MNLEEIKRRLTKLETSCLCDADKSLRAMDPGIRPVRTDLKLIGTAFTATCHDDFLTVIQALRDAAPGDVLVVDGQGGHAALAGELFATEAHRKGIAGIVVDGSVRDVATLRTLDIPVYSRGFFPTSGTTTELTETGIEITCGGVTVQPGEILFADQDGIIVASAAQLTELIPIGEGILEREAKCLARMAQDDSLLDMLNFEEHAENVRAGKESALKFTL